MTELKKQHGFGYHIWNNDLFIVLLYLVVIVIANITVSIWGPSVAVLNAFLLVGFSLTSRDRLHDSWHGDKLKIKMAILIITGSAISFVLGAGKIAIASMIAFAFSELVDATVYSKMYNKNKLYQVNMSNIASSGVDSVIFPLIAFGFPPLVVIMLLQFLAKIFGGFAWSIVLAKNQ